VETLAKSHQFPNDVIILDGMWGVGKSAISPVVASFRGVEKKRIDPIIEYVTALEWLRLIDRDTAGTLLATYADYFTYHNAIGREVNFRVRDDSGIRNSPGWSRYLRRLFASDGDHLEAVISESNPGTFLVTDLAIVGLATLTRTLKSRLRFIEVVRHPFHLFPYYQRYLADYSRQREFTLSFELGEYRVPWVATGWSDLFARSTVADRAALLVSRSQRIVTDSIVESSTFVIPFEQFVTQTDVFVERLSHFLDRPMHYSLRKVKRRHRLPRSSVSHGTASNVRSWIGSPQQSESEIYSSLREAAKASCSSQAFAELEDAAVLYESAWPSALSEIGAQLR